MQFSDIKDIFSLFGGRVVIVGMGNSLRADDGFGPALISRLKGKIKSKCFDVGTTPENYLGKIARENPQAILFIDALHLDLSPGECAILKKEQILNSGLTTHDISLSMLIEFLETRTKAEIYMLGVQPERLALGEEMSEQVKKTIDNLARIFLEVDHA